MQGLSSKTDYKLLSLKTNYSICTAYWNIQYQYNELYLQVVSVQNIVHDAALKIVES